MNLQYAVCSIVWYLVLGIKGLTGQHDSNHGTHQSHDAYAPEYVSEYLGHACLIYFILLRPKN